MQGDRSIAQGCKSQISDKHSARLRIVSVGISHVLIILLQFPSWGWGDSKSVSARIESYCHREDSKCSETSKPLENVIPYMQKSNVPESRWEESVIILIMQLLHLFFCLLFLKKFYWESKFNGTTWRYFVQIHVHLKFITILFCARPASYSS